MNVNHRRTVPWYRAQLGTLSALSTGIWVFIISILLASPLIGGQDTTRIIIDTSKLTLKVMQGDKETLTFSNIAIGRYGTAVDKRKGDDKTPLGHFVIGWISEKTSFHRFFGLLYPGKEYAERAFETGRLDKKTWNRIRQAFDSGRLPPQDTALGGNLGIHGIGKGNINIHEKYNWTSGCVALTNDQIDRLAVLIKVGTSVEIR